MISSLVRYLTGSRTRSVVLVGLVLFVAAVVVVNRMAGTRAVDAQPGRPAAPARVDVPPAPGSTPAIGIYIHSEVMASGDIEVQQWIRTGTPVSRLTLITLDPDNLPGTVEAEKVVVSASDGSRLAVRKAVGTKQQSVRLRAPSTDLYLTYVITGETISDELSTVSGRKLVRVTAMDVGYDGEAGPTVHLISGPGTVLNAACLPADAAYNTPPVACGVAAPDGDWEVSLRGLRRHERVLAALDT